MNPAAILTALEKDSIRVFLEGDRLRVNAPKGAITPPVRSTLETLKADLLSCVESGDLARKVDTTGRQAIYFTEHAGKWSNAEWRQRAERLCQNIDETTALLRAAGLTLEECGWSVTPAGEWHRTSEPAKGSDPARFSLWQQIEAAREAVEVAWSELPDVLTAAREKSGRWQASEDALFLAGVDGDPEQVEASVALYLSLHAELVRRWNAAAQNLSTAVPGAEVPAAAEAARDEAVASPQEHSREETIPAPAYADRRAPTPNAPVISRAGVEDEPPDPLSPYRPGMRLGCELGELEVLRLVPGCGCLCRVIEATPGLWLAVNGFTAGEEYLIASRSERWQVKKEQAES